MHSIASSEQTTEQHTTNPAQSHCLENQTWNLPCQLRLHDKSYHLTIEISALDIILFLPTRTGKPDSILHTLVSLCDRRRPRVERESHHCIMRIFMDLVASPAIDRGATAALPAQIVKEAATTAGSRSGDLSTLLTRRERVKDRGRWSLTFHRCFPIRQSRPCMSRSGRD